MLRPDSPFYLRPRPAVLPWLVRFVAASRAARASRGAEAIRAISIDSLELPAEVLGPQETLELEPALAPPVVASTYFPREAHVDPKRFVHAVGRAAAEAGAEVRTGVDVRAL